MNPNEAANFPGLHRCPLGYLSLAFSLKVKNNLAETPFNICSAFTGVIVRPIPTTQCTCSGCTFSSIIFISCINAALLMQAVIKFLYSCLRNILYLYFVHHSKCHIDIPMLWLLLSYFPKLSLICICVFILSPRRARCRAPQSLFTRESYRYKRCAGSSILLSLFYIFLRI